MSNLYRVARPAGGPQDRGLFPVVFEIARLTVGTSFWYDTHRVFYTGGIFVPLNELASPERIVGEREVRRAILKGTLRKLFVAADADPIRAASLVKEAEAAGAEVERAESRLLLGRACAIDRSATAAGLLRR